MPHGDIGKRPRLPVLCKNSEGYPPDLPFAAAVAGLDDRSVLETLPDASYRWIKAANKKKKEKKRKDKKRLRRAPCWGSLLHGPGNLRCSEASSQIFSRVQQHAASEGQGAAPPGPPIGDEMETAVRGSRAGLTAYGVQPPRGFCDRQAAKGRAS